MYVKFFFSEALEISGEWEMFDSVKYYFINSN